MKTVAILLMLSLSPFAFSADRLPKPSDAEIKTAQQLIVELAKDDANEYKAQKIDAPTLGERLQKMLDDAEEPATKYTLLALMQKVYLEGKEYEKAALNAAQFAEMFEGFDAFTEQSSIVKSMMNNRTVPKETSLALLSKLLQAAFDNGDMEICDQWVRQFQTPVRSFARVEGYGEYQELVKQISAIRESAKRAETLKSALAKSPDDPKLNLKYAEFLIQNGQWDEALPHYAKGDDAKIAKMAQLELSDESKDADHGKVADFWWELGENTKEATLKPYYQQHAVTIYGEILESYAGLKKKLVEKRIADFKAPPDPVSNETSSIAEIVKIPGVKYTASSTYSEWPSPSKLNDGDINTWWSSKEIPGPHWVQMELPEIISINEIHVLNKKRYGKNDPASPKDFEVLAGNDGKNWKKIISGTLELTTEPQKIVLPRNAKGKYIQFKILSNFGEGYTSIAELYVYGKPTPAMKKQLLEEAKKPIITVSSTHHDGRFKKEYLMDENPNTEWHSAEGDHTGFFIMEFKQQTALRGLRIFPRLKLNTGRPHAYEIYASNDQTNWKKIHSGTLKDIAAFQDIKFPLPQKFHCFKFLAVDCYVNKEIKKREVCISEVEIIW